jgi:hypothetical protein
MSSKFTRVEETENTPDFISNIFAPKTASVQEDPYAALRAGQAERQAKIARESMGQQRTAAPVANDWERLDSGVRYSERRMLPTDTRMSNLVPEDSSVRSVRRASYDTDEGLNARPNPADFFGHSADPFAMLSRGATMWDSDLEGMMRESANRDGMFDTETHENKAAKRHATWEEHQTKSLRPLQRSSARAHGIVRTSMENVAAGRFGLVDYSAMDEREAQRVEMLEHQREQRLSIRAKDHATPDQRRSDWENGVSTRQSSVQDHSAPWLNNLLGEEG